MRIDCVSDLHGYLPNLKGGEILILAGDHTATDSVEDWHKFLMWLHDLDYDRKLFIAGNHDNYLINNTPSLGENVHYLEDSGVRIKGVKFWGSPWTKSLVGMNPVCKAFTLETDELLKAKWDLISNDSPDVLITHSPPKDILDKEQRNHYRCGSPALLDRVKELKPKFHVFGHIHESRGVLQSEDTKFINCSYVGRSYKVHKEDEVISIII